MNAVIDRLRTNQTIRTAIQAFRVSRSLTPPTRFVVDLLRNAPVGEYQSRRTCQALVLRPRLDLQVASELVAHEGYSRPPQVERLLEAHRPLRVLDLGANIGLFVLSVLARDPEAHVIAVEPDVYNLEVLRRNVAVNGYGQSVDVVRAAAGTSRGAIRFAEGLTAMSHISDTGEYGVEVPLIDAFEFATGCSLVKIDIEGGEWPILRDERLREIDAAAIAIEWHERGSNSGTPEENAERLLRAAGFVTALCRSEATTGELWAWRPRRLT